MKLLVYPEHMAERYIPKKGELTGIIRIYQENISELNDLNGDFDETLLIQYHDIYFEDMFEKDKETYLTDYTIVPYSKELHDSLWLFLDTVKYYDTIIIHCSAGVSRSPAVAIAMSWYYNLPVLEKELCATFERPNNYLLNSLAKELNIKRKYLNYNKSEQCYNYMKELSIFGKGHYIEDIYNEQDDLLF